VIALERGRITKGIHLCEDAISKEPENPLFYLNLGRVLLKADRKKEAIEAVRKGLDFGHNEEAVFWLKSLGVRKKPVFSFLHRESFLNRHLGIIFNKLGIRSETTPSEKGT
jgi:tetratricopeptide (TPR) repeat protein